MPDREPHKIVVGVSSLEDSSSAVEHACKAARRQERGVHLVHVLHPAWGNSLYMVDVTLTDDILLAGGTAIVEECKAHGDKFSGGVVPISTEVIRGSTVPTLVDASENAAAVVLQHHRMGRSHIPTMSVTNGVGARAHAPVVAVPDTWRQDEPHPAVVVVGVDQAREARAVLSAALEETTWRGAALHVVHAWHYSDAFDADVFAGAAGVAERDRLVAELRTDLAELLEGHPGVAHDVLVVHGRPADVLVDQSHHSELVVVGRHSPRIPLGSHLGPVVRAVLGHAACPVMVVDPGS